MSRIVSTPNYQWLTGSLWVCDECQSVVAFAEEDRRDVDIFEGYASISGGLIVLSIVAPCPICEKERTFSKSPREAHRD